MVESSRLVGNKARLNIEHFSLLLSLSLSLFALFVLLCRVVVHMGASPYPPYHTTSPHHIAAQRRYHDPNRPAEMWILSEILLLLLLLRDSSSSEIIRDHRSIRGPLQHVLQRSIGIVVVLLQRVRNRRVLHLANIHA
jgi:hypothetical protein